MSIRDSASRDVASRRLTGALLLVLFVGTLTVHAQSGSEPESEFSGFNFAYSAYIGSGIYVYDGRSVYILRIPITYTVRSHEDRAFGIALRLKTTLGWYNLEEGDLLYPDLDSLGTVTLLPGIEFRVPIFDNWVLEPFLDVGYAWDTETDAGSALAGLGVESRAHFPWKNRQFVLWNELLWAGNEFEGPDTGDDDFGKFRAELEYRLPLGFTIRGLDIALGPFGTWEHYFNEAVVPASGGGSERGLAIANRYELGLKIGTAERSRVWLVTVPRLGLGYRFGDGSDTVRLIFAFRY